MIKKYPKLRGYRFNSRAQKPIIVNIATLEKNFVANDTINPQILLAKRLISKIKGKLPQVKILAKGNLTKPFNIENCELSKTAAENITKAKGTIK